ncbi:hypothetical protein QPK31_14225 [Massilia sp. YIM B02769]|uniref:hypothetical protein n=1 Tax=Massilia sp. YIM B02769 TaxID=3050129 RepID=UPI0025B73457|nr:hypothetical protein [Massilia sp. YIM B02769]MDN4059379.1 hypothetical protein [Massilia sp. YIM B02769]
MDDRLDRTVGSLMPGASMTCPRGYVRHLDVFAVMTRSATTILDGNVGDMLFDASRGRIHFRYGAFQQ